MLEVRVQTQTSSDKPLQYASPYFRDTLPFIVWRPGAIFSAQKCPAFFAGKGYFAIFHDRRYTFMGFQLYSNQMHLLKLIRLFITVT